MPLSELEGWGACGGGCRFAEPWSEEDAEFGSDGTGEVGMGAVPESTTELEAGAGEPTVESVGTGVLARSVPAVLLAFDARPGRAWATTWESAPVPITATAASHLVARETRSNPASRARTAEPPASAASWRRRFRAIGGRVMPRMVSRVA